MGGISFPGLYLDRALTNVSVEYQNSGLAASEIAKRVPVSEKTGRIWVGGKERFHRFDTSRESGDVAREMPSSRFSNLTYFCQKHDLRKLLSDDEQANSPGYDLRVTFTEELSDTILLDIEFAVQSLITGGTVPNTTLTGGNQWSDFVNSDPIAAVEAQRPIVHLGATRRPNVFACGEYVWSKLRQHPKIVDRFKYTELEDGYVSDSQLRRVFGVDMMIILSAMYDTAAFGAAPSLDFVWGKIAFLAYIPPAPSLRTPSLIYSYWLDHVQGQGGAKIPVAEAIGDTGSTPQGGPVIFTYRSEPRQGDFIEARSYWDVELAVPTAGYVWNAAVA